MWALDWTWVGTAVFQSRAACGVLGVLGGFGKWHGFGTFEEWAWESRPRALVFFGLRSYPDLSSLSLPPLGSSICPRRMLSTLFLAKWNGDGLFERRGGEGRRLVTLRCPPSPPPWTIELLLLRHPITIPQGFGCVTFEAAEYHARYGTKTAHWFGCEDHLLRTRHRPWNEAVRKGEKKKRKRETCSDFPSCVSTMPASITVYGACAQSWMM